MCILTLGGRKPLFIKNRVFSFKNRAHLETVEHGSRVLSSPHNLLDIFSSLSVWQRFSKATSLSLLTPATKSRGRQVGPARHQNLDRRHRRHFFQFSPCPPAATPAKLPANGILRPEMPAGRKQPC